MPTEQQSQDRAARRFYIGFTVFQLLVILMTYTSLFHTYLHMWYGKAGGAAHIFGFIFHAGSILWLWKADSWFTGGTKVHPGIVWLGLFVLGVITSCGFNFSL